MNDKYLLEMQGITKSFPGVLALDNVSIKLKAGSVHALMGENGAGKSTLMKCLFGIYKEDSGIIKLEGKEVKFNGAKDALDSGVSMIHQELSNVPERSVTENIWLGREPKTKFGLLDHKKMEKDTVELMSELEMLVKPSTRMGSLSISVQQGCEIAKAVSYNSKIVVMDEPTSSLTENEVEHLFKIIAQLKAKNVGIIYISHKMEEIFKIADDISVMRDGKMVGTYPASDLNNDELIKLMVGRDSTQRFPQVNAEKGEVVLEVENLTSKEEKSFRDINFKLRRGEILGLGGLVGAQRTELVESIFGLRAIKEGTVKIEGKPFEKVTPDKAIRNKVALITEDRRGSGIFPLMSITTNTTVSSLGRYRNKFGLLRHKELSKLAKEYNEKLRTKTPTMDTFIQNLSGGNQQKVIISRWLMTLPDILIMDEPTRGIDVGAKYEIYTIMAELAKQGKAIIMVSSEMPELIGMSDRIMVLCEGRQTGILEGEDVTQENIMTLATKFMSWEDKENEQK